MFFKGGVGEKGKVDEEERGEKRKNEQVEMGRRGRWKRRKGGKEEERGGGGDGKKRKVEKGKRG